MADKLTIQSTVGNGHTGKTSHNLMCDVTSAKALVKWLKPSDFEVY